jgi:hypothetical protein
MNDLEIMKKCFNENIKETTYKYSKYDFYDDNCIYELKTRTNKYEDYPTTIIAEDKILIDNDKKQKFVFKFSDGSVYYITYKEKRFNKFEKRPFRRTDRGIDILKNYIYIPIEKLKKIEFKTRG